MEEGDTNEPPSTNKNQLKFLKAIMSVNKSSSSEESIFSDYQLSETSTVKLIEDDFNGELKIEIISDDEDAEIEHISDMSNPSYDPRRYFSYKFRQSPTRMDNAPVPEETNRAAKYPEIEVTKKHTCVDESTTHDLNFATRYPNYFRDFKFIKYPPLEDVSSPEFQPNRPHYTIDIEKDFNNFTPWRERAEREEQLASSSKEAEIIHLEDIDNANESQNVLEERVSEFQFSSETRPYYQEPSTNPTDKHEFVNLNKMQRDVTFKSVNQISEPLPCYSTDAEAWEYIRVSNTELSSQENLYSDLQKLVNPPPAHILKSTEDRNNNAPLIYEDFKEHILGPKPQHWIDFQETGEIGKTVAIFDSRDFGYNNKNIKPTWIDHDFDFHAPIRDDFHQFSKIFMTNIPFYENESEEIQKFARQYKFLRAGPKYNIQEPPQKTKSTNLQETQESKSDIHLQKEPEQNDFIKGTSASETKISKFKGTIKTKVKIDQNSTIKEKPEIENKTQDATNVREDKPVNETPDPNELKLKTYASKSRSVTSMDLPLPKPNVQYKILRKPLAFNQLKSVLKPSRRENLTATDDECFEKRVYWRSDIAGGSINPTLTKRVTFKLDENNEERANYSDASQNVKFHTGVSMPTKILTFKKEEIPEENADKSDVSNNTQSYTKVSMPTKRNEEMMIEGKANKSDVIKNAQPHSRVLTLTSKTVQSDISVSKQQDAKSVVKTKKSEFYTKFSELNKQQFKTCLKQQVENIPEKYKRNKRYLHKSRISQPDQASSPNTSCGNTGIKSKVDNMVGKQGKISESGDTKANNKADKGNKSSKPKQGNEQKHQKSRHWYRASD